MKNRCKLLLAVSLFATAISASATTIGYWRFENAGNLGADSSGNGRDLFNFNNPASASLGLSGVGSNVPKTIPQTGATNTLAVSLNGSNMLFRPSQTAFLATNQFAAEVYFNLNSIALNTSTPLLSRWDSQGVQVMCWFFGLRQDTSAANPIRFRFVGSGDNSTSTAKNTTTLSVKTNTDYYAAAIFNAGTVTIYLADLSTNNPTLQSEILTGFPANLAPVAAPFRVGAFRTSAFVTNYFNGLLDEVRFSDQAIATNLSLFYAGAPTAPQITIPPQNVSVPQTSNATFVVEAQGIPVTSYQWYVVTNSVTNTVSGATGSTLTVSNVTLSQSGNQYFVIVANTGGSAASAFASLDVVSFSALTSPTVGYWRFENGGNLGLDSSSNAFNLVTVGVPASAVLPDALSGLPGALFSKTIPLTGQTNISALSLDGTGTNYLSHADSALFGFGAQMTVEAYFNVSNVPANVTLPIASQWNSPGTAGWVFGVREQTPGLGDVALRFGIDADGSGAKVVAQSATNLVLATNTDYYAAIVYNAGTVTFYLKDLSVPSPSLQSQVISGFPTNLVRGATDFRIGGWRQGGIDQTFPGLLDEVRLSRVALTSSGLINGTAVPFPPVIDVPVHDLTVGEHSDGTFTVAASSPTQPLTYQWYSGASLIGGATNTSYTITNALLSQSGNQYSVVITNLGGAVTSGPVTLTVVDVSSPTIGYWRFEDQGNPGLDSSAAGLDLANFNQSAGVSLPASGSPGALFSKTIPLTSQTNTSALQLDGASYLYHGDSPSFTVSTQMTVEAYFNVSSLNTSSANLYPIASKFHYSGQASWFFGVRSDTNGSFLRFTSSSDGASSTFSLSATNWAIQAGVDYYAAVVYNAGKVTFYLADLSSTNPALRSANYTSGATNLFHSTEYFAIGEGYSLQQWAFPGLIDEVRLSRVALTAQQLLMPVPATSVPATLAATAGDAQVALHWGSVSNASTYSLKRSLTNGGPYTVIATLTATNYLNTNLLNGTTYYYVVSGVGVGGESANSTQVSATPVSSATPPTILPVYVDATGTNLVLSAVTVSGHNYVLQSTPGLEGTPVWTPVLTNAGTGGPITNAVPISHLKAKEFFRYLVQ